MMTYSNLNDTSLREIWIRIKFPFFKKNTIENMFFMVIPTTFAQELMSLTRNTKGMYLNVFPV